MIALALLTFADEDHPALRTAALIGVAVLIVAVTGFALVLSHAERAQRIGDLAARLANRALRVVRRGPVEWGGESFVRFRSQALGLLRRRWHVITVATLAGHLTVFVLLVVCLRVTGVTESEVTLIEAFAAWALVRIIGAIPLTPAGVGFVEVGLTGALVAFGASERRSRGRHAALPRVHGAADARARTARCSHLAHAPPGGVDRFTE